jgi:hypothetical protein
MTNPFSLAANILAPAADHDPAKWITERMGIHLWSKQQEIVRSVRDHKRTAVAACHAAGKSHVAAAIVCEWLENHQPGQAFVVTTAPSYGQVRAILWRYINQFHARNGLRGRCNQVEWFMGGELVAIGRKPADHDDDAFQGIHAPYVLAVLDEAGGVPAQFWNAVEAVTTSDDCRILAIGNPDHPQSPFRDAFESEQWNSIRISAFDNPNFTDESCPIDVKKNLVTPTWVEDAKTRWGDTSPVYQSKVLGLFPDTSEDSVISYSHLVAAINKEPPEKPTTDPTILGIDVAGGGTDMTVVRQRRGNRALKQWTTSLSDSADLTAWILRIIVETSAKVVRIDSTGIGWGIVGQLREKAPGVLVVGINAAAKPAKPRFLNSRAEMWWAGRELVEAGTLDLSEAVDADNLLAQLTAPKWELVPSNGKIKIESKDDIKTRIGRSPDNADALLLAFYDRFGSGVPEDSTPNPARVNLDERASTRGLARRMGTQLPTARRIGLNRWQ